MQSIYELVPEYREGMLDPMRLPAPLVDYLRIAVGEQCEWERVQDEHLDSL